MRKQEQEMTVQKTLIDNLPAGIERALLRILNYHVGEENAISRSDLMIQLANSGFRMKDDRPVRALINELRNRGELILSKGGAGGGYWMAMTKEEVEHFLDFEVHPRAMDLLETERSLKMAMEKRFGLQERLF
jgi:hypothetical protein